jgi:PAS domain S-box-containing protein
VTTHEDSRGSQVGEPPGGLAEAAKAALREGSEERYRTLVETVSDWVWEVDENIVYTFVSPKIRDLLGYEPGEVLGKTPFDLMPPDEALRVKGIFIPLAARRESFPAVENANLHKDGHLVLLETSGTPFFDADGTFRGYRGVDREIGARKRAEEELRKNEEHLRQVRKFEEIGRLAGGLAHHLNNLMTVVTGYSELLLTRIPESDPRRGDIEKIRGAGERAGELTRELLAFSRRQILQPRAVETNRFLSELSTTLRDLAGRFVRFTFSPGEDAGSIRVDPEPLHLALVRLVANARDAMPGGGELNISTAAAELTGSIEGIDAAPGRYVLLTVRDSGSGIDAETRARIFEPFYSLKTGSEGMGLPSIYGFVKQSGGYIFVDSRPGHGTTFRIYFPRLDRPEDLLHGDTRPLAGTPDAG